MLLDFDNRFVRDLPGDPEPRNYRRTVRRALWSRVDPTPVPDPAVIAVADEVAALLGLTPEDVRHPDFARLFAGNLTTDAMVPYAARYGGHQFGHWAGQLGDGRAITLGERVADGQRWEVQLKGAGPTPYSRGGDGRAVLRSSIREFVCSEAMHHLGIPTTRALCLVATGEGVYRDMFYDGRPEIEPGAVVTRVAPTFLRFGSLQILASQGEADLLTGLLGRIVAWYSPHLGAPGPDTYRAWLVEVAERTATLVAHWQRVGFVHGVLNTDNMSILGLTIDYGPYGWLDTWDPDWTPNTTDAERRRYRFGQQPAVALWNLERLAEAVQPLVGADGAQAALRAYVDGITAAMEQTWRDKLGLDRYDADLVADLDTLLASVETDPTIFYRRLATVAAASPSDCDTALITPLAPAYYATPGATTRARLAGWIRRWLASAAPPPEVRTARMNAANPAVIFRNYLAQQAIDDAEAGDYARIHHLLDALRTPYDDPADPDLAARRPDWARDRPGCSTLSCSS